MCIASENQAITSKIEQCSKESNKVVVIYIEGSIMTEIEQKPCKRVKAKSPNIKRCIKIIKLKVHF